MSGEKSQHKLKLNGKERLEYSIGRRFQRICKGIKNESIDRIATLLKK